MLNIKKVGFTISVGLALLFSGCGGSGGSDDATPDVEEPLIPTTVTKTISGVAVDGYISGATVCLDINSNDICDSDEPSTTTSDDGTFSFDTTATGNYPIIIGGGTDTATDEAFDGVLKNIIELSDTNTSLSTNITPLTTLSTNIYKENIKRNPDFTPTQAKQTMATNLGLTLAQIDKDPLKDKDVFEKAQQIIQTTKILQSSINIEDKDSFNHIMEQIATTIKEDTTSKDLNITKLIENLETTQYDDKNISISEDIKLFAKEYKDEISLKTEAIEDINHLDNLQNSLKTYTNSAKEKISNNTSDTLSQTLSSIKENTTIELLQATNSKPTISNTPSTAIEEESTYTYTPNTTDSDNDTLVYTIVNKPTWATFDTATGKLTGKPSYNSADTYKDIVISVSDGIVTTTLSKFDIVVSNTNQAPTISGTPPSSIGENKTYSFTPIVSDQDNDSLTFSIQNKPNWMNFDTSTGKLTGDTKLNNSGTYSDIIISVTDGKLTTSLSAFNIVVSDDIVGNVESKYYGKWIEAQSGDELNIDTTTILSYTAVNDNLLEVISTTNGVIKQYLRASKSKINLKGRLTKKESALRSLRNGYASIGDIDVILQNILDQNIKATITTDENGYFEDNSLPAGDYTIQAQVTTKNETTQEEIIEEINTTINISEEVEDLGTFVLLEESKHNFKADLLLNHGYILADDTQHTATIRVKNISETKANGIWFDIKVKDGDTILYESDINGNILTNDINYTDTTMSDDSIGTIFSKDYKDIDISFAFDPIYKNNKDITVELTINDADGNSWNETMNFILYKGTFDINLATSQANVKGYIRLPYNDQILAIDMSKGSITLPLLSEDKHYPLVLANSNEIEGETKYSIGVNSATLDFSNFKNTAAYENDDSEDEATEIGLYDSIISYIHYGDLDYWKITTEENKNKLHKDDNFIAQFGSIAGDTVVSNSITITDNTIFTVSVDNNASIILNGIDTNQSDVIVNTEDKVAIKYKIPSHDNNIFVHMTTNTNFNRVFKIGIIVHQGVLYKTVRSIKTSKIWLDRNLGASRVCTYATDKSCIGDYYQWGRNTDGHEKKYSTIVNVISKNIINTGSSFIISQGSWSDWTSIDNDGNKRMNKWSSINGSSVCPKNFRVPTAMEIHNELYKYNTSLCNNATNGFLKLNSNTGVRSGYSGEIGNFGNDYLGSLWSTTGEFNYCGADNSGIGDRDDGINVRCIKD